MSPAAERNKQPILEGLRPWLPSSGLVLEVASGGGQHAAHFARALPGLRFQPSDLTPEFFDLMTQASRELPNLAAPVVLDASADDWPIEAADFVYNANMIHISPIDAAQGLFRGAARVLPPGGRLATYGPYFEDGRPPAASNLAFHDSLRARNPNWGLRRRAELEGFAQASEMELEARLEMPANNLLLLWRRCT